MKTIYCDREYSGQILEILNDAITNTTAIFDYKPRSVESMISWFDTKTKNNFPVIGIVDGQNKLLGFGSYGAFRAWPAYRYTIEHSLYVHKNHRGKGLGKIILSEIIKNATRQDYHCLVAGINSTNQVSIKLHKAFGFEFCGRIKHAGYKFSNWLDLEFYQLLLSTPLRPVEE